MNERKPDGGLRTAAYWHERAEKARALSEQMKDRDARATMEKIATMYEAMAKTAAARETKV
jgi:hypothetical protein